VVCQGASAVATVSVTPSLFCLVVFWKAKHLGSVSERVRSVKVIPLAMQQYMLLQRNLVYTGITRGKKLVVLIGQRKAFGMAVRNNPDREQVFGVAGQVNGAGLMTARDRITRPAQILRQIHLHLGCGLMRHRVQVLEQFW
jgi:hypothetical protein